MTIDEILEELRSMGSESIKKIYLRHGACEPFFGVKVGDMKKIVKQVKKDHALSLALFDTGNSDAMYLAGLIADEKKISKEELRHWAEKATWHMVSEYTVAWIASESPYGWELGLEWIESDSEKIASAGWSALASLVTIRPDAELDLKHLEKLLDRVANTIQTAPNRVRYVMNNFVIAVGCAVVPLSDKAIDAAQQMGVVEVFMGDTACQVPSALAYIEKVRGMGRIGKKKKMARC